MNFIPSFTRYLAAKKGVDDRALNRNVWDTFCQSLPHATQEMPLRVLEVGAGIGTMIERLIEHGTLTHAIYTAIDADANNNAELNRRVRK
jgi:16S rRNA A1518/A1519 N6-dimethyltransferase RsmA/KsgA/DIM1 with predicted DNA glycosylase/AP lyase activity